jgi:methyl-accepting chemotaxis protein
MKAQVQRNTISSRVKNGVIRNISFHTIKGRLIIIFALILIVPSFAIGWTSYSTAKDNVDKQMEAATSSNINLLNHLITQMTEVKVEDLNILAQEISLESISSIQENEDSEVRRKLDDYVKNHSEVDSVMIVGNKEELMYSPSSLELAADVSLTESIFYKQALENTGEVIITEPTVSTDNGNTVVIIAKAATDGQSVVAVTLNLTKIQEITGEVKIGEQGFIAVFSSGGAMIVSPNWGSNASAGVEGEESVGTGSGDAGDIGVGDAPAGATEEPEGGASAMFDSEAGITEMESPEGGVRKLMYITNEITGWKIAGDRSEAEVTSEAAPIFLETILVIAISLAVGTIIVFFVVRSITKPLRHLTETSRAISLGDLNHRVNIKAKGELGELGESFNLMVDSLRTVLMEVGRSSDQLATSAEELSASSGQTSTATEHIAGIMEQMVNGANEQVKKVGDSVQTIHEVSTNINHIVNSAQTAASTTVQASKKSTEGARVVQTAVEQMNSISGSVGGLGVVISHLATTSQEIGQIIEVITELSNQTNLLSLNAAIEAARAGEHGRGFAVVADEVKKLAQYSAQSANEVATLIQAIRNEIVDAQQSMQSATKEVGLGMGVFYAAGSLFSEIEGIIVDVNNQVEEVSAAARQISVGTIQVVQAIEEISAVSEYISSEAHTASAATEQQLAAMEEISSSATHLTHMAGGLQAVVDKFKM